ncbi:MAG: hypothetical protein M9921_14510 [Fimbriimonadaceae bacterium]|nr:hypothetical protein [Chthonomonadaceae bacterium]MCO5298057.1 hypothetical protein [Fimbriimonadaceae bacterium]
MSWFETLVGFPETSPKDVREKVLLEGERLTSLVTQRSFGCGRLETPSLGELRDRVGALPSSGGRLQVRELVADAIDLHADPANADCLFQVASQFNLLEMAGPSLTPEDGVGIYENDPTQGPACAIAAGAGTLYRNYFAPVRGAQGQSESNQIDCLEDLGCALGNEDEGLWVMRNGYALATREGLQAIADRLASISEDERDALRQKLRIGVHWNTQVTVRGSTHAVTQAFCSALPVAYCAHSARDWEPFARLVLEASYEAAICAAILNSAESGQKRAFFTLLGGGAFGNDLDWILSALGRALGRARNRDLEVAIVSRGSSNPHIQKWLAEFR